MSFDTPLVTVVAAEIVDSQGRYLIAQRNAHAVMPLLWEFPGGRVRDGETEQQALKRCLQATLGVDVACDEPRLAVERPYDRYRVRLVAWSARIVSGELTCKYVREFRWVRPEDFGRYDFPPADQASIDQLLGFTAEG
ncbi:MAG: (deoxy)nucleoside triphosphate pyrophosphohydrolase [Myxococcales bacterium]|nr:(deoxy)nucleoside triphosphate pyrophosphohydrolase [Myxococcales bacterium]